MSLIIGVIDVVLLVEETQKIYWYTTKSINKGLLLFSMEVLNICWLECIHTCMYNDKH